MTPGIQWPEHQADSQGRFEIPRGQETRGQLLLSYAVLRCDSTAGEAPDSQSSLSGSIRPSRGC